jgi:hypothetical protein
MSGRRSHARFAVTPPAEGVVRVPRDVLVQTDEGRELVVISPSPGVIDEYLNLELSDAGPGSSLRVQVAGSRPIVVEGAVRHRLRLRLVPPGADHAPGGRSDRC